MTISFHPIPGAASAQPFAECRGADLSRDLAPDEIETLRDGLLKHGLLLFRDQGAMTPEREVVFNRAFGWHDASQDDFLFGFGAPAEEHRVSGGAQIPHLPEVSVLGNVMLDDYHGIRNTQLKGGLGLSHSGWHADGLHDMFDGLPEMTTMFNPLGWRTSRGGETLFTSGVLAAERMDSDLLEELRNCVVGYARFPNDDEPDEARRASPGKTVMVDEGTRRVGFTDGAPKAPMLDFEFSLDDTEDAGRHPCIRTHPVTGQEALYVTPGCSVCLFDAATGAVRHDVGETVDLLSRALRPSAGPEIRYEHQWREGDFVAWINTLVLHSASDPWEVKGSRLIHRVRLSTPKTRMPGG